MHTTNYHRSLYAGTRHRERKNRNDEIEWTDPFLTKGKPREALRSQAHRAGTAPLDGIREGGASVRGGARQLGNKVERIHGQVRLSLDRGRN